jgi:pilus assembly protein Flp/PilA
LAASFILKLHLMIDCGQCRYLKVLRHQMKRAQQKGSIHRGNCRDLRVADFCNKIGVITNKKDNSGVTAIEYGLIAPGISVTIITVVNGLGTKLNTTFTKRSNARSSHDLGSRLGSLENEARPRDQNRCLTFFSLMPGGPESRAFQ